MKKKIGFNIMLLLIGIVPVVVLGTILTVVSIQKITGAMENDVYAKLLVAATDLRSYYEYDLRDADELEYEEDYVDSLKGQNIELTVFKDDTRFMTSLYKDDGTRNIGTQADAAIYANVKSGQTVTKNGVKIGSKVYYVAYIPMYDGSGNFWGMAFAGAPEDDIRATISSVRNIILITLFAAITVTILLAILLAMKISRSMKAMVGELDNTASGRIAKTPAVKSIVKEIEQIGESIGSLKGKLSEVITKVQNTSKSLKTAGDELASSAEQASQASEQVTNAVDGISKGAVTQAESVQDAAAKTDSIGDDIDNISTNVDALDGASKKMQESCEKASKALDDIVKQNVNVAEAVQEISDTIQATNGSANEIAKFSAAINDIASQTNLLSLNASIEAARAGEAGKGFAVVADEIRQLADQSKKSADEIKTIVDRLLSDAQSSVKVMDTLNENIRFQGDQIQTTQSVMNEVSENVSVVADNSQNIADMVGNLNTAKTSLVEIVQDLSAISEENAASTEETNASMEELNATFTIISEAAANLQGIARELADIISYFDLSETGNEATQLLKVKSTGKEPAQKKSFGEGTPIAKNTSSGETMKIRLFGGKLTVEISKANWEYLCRARFVSDNPAPEVVQAEFIAATKITSSKKNEWERASEKFDAYITNMRSKGLEY